MFRPGTILTRSGDYFQVFSQFKKSCLEHLHRSLPAMAPRVKRQAPLQVSSDPIPQQVEGFDKPQAALREHWPAGEAQAQARLARFLDETIDDYHQLRDLPAKPGTSQLSTYLAAGVISPASACTARWPATKASSTVAAAVCKPGSTSCSGANSTSTS